MPLIDLKSDLAAVVTTALNDNERRVQDSSRLLKLLASGKGLTFAAKQAMLDPSTALERLASITTQLSLNIVPFGLGNHFGINPNLTSTSEGSAEEPTLYKDLGQVQKAASKSVEFDVRKKFYDKGFEGTRFDSPDFDEKYSQPDYDSDIDIKTKVSRSYSYTDSIREISDVTTTEDKALELDTVPFYFSTYKYDDGIVAVDRLLPFQAFFSSISDSVQGSWNSFNFTGRGERFHVYQMYGRNISMTFRVAAFSEDQLSIIHQRLAKLQKLTAPKYSSSGFMQGNVINITIGNFVKSLPGFVTQVGASVDANTPWEIENRTQILPHVVTVSLGFTVIEAQTPRAN